MSFDVKYDDRLQEIREAGAAAIKAIRQLRSTAPTPRETLDAEVARIAKEKLHLRSRCPSDGRWHSAIPDQGSDRDEITFVATDGKHFIEPVAPVTNIVAG
jgi:hypothetical protein